MAFTGTPLFTQISESLLRVTAIGLAGAAAGTLSFSAGTGDFKFPVSFGPGINASYNAGFSATAVALQDSIQVTVPEPVTAVVTFVPIRVVKTGTTRVDFLITMTNDTAATASATCECYIRFH